MEEFYEGDEATTVLKVANRGAGEFVGEMEVVVGNNGRFEELNDVGSDPTLRQKRQRGETQSMKNAFMDDKYMASARGPARLAASRCGCGCGCECSVRKAPAPPCVSSCTARFEGHCWSPFSALLTPCPAPLLPPLLSSPQGAALAKKYGVKWVGSKRTASVRAVTDVEVMVLKREDMQWVLENDEGVQGEIMEAVKKGLGELQRAKSESQRQRSSNGGSSKNVFDAWMGSSPSGASRFAAADPNKSGQHRSSGAAAGGSSQQQQPPGVKHVSSFGEGTTATDALNWALDEGSEEEMSAHGNKANADWFTDDQAAKGQASTGGGKPGSATGGTSKTGSGCAPAPTEEVEWDIGLPQSSIARTGAGGFRA